MKLCYITDEDAFEAALIAKIGNNPYIKRDGQSITIFDGLKNRNVCIYFSGSNTRVLNNGYEVIEYCFEIYDFLRSKGYTWKL